MREYAVHHCRATFREFVRLAHPHTLRASLLWLPLRIGLVRWHPQTGIWPDSIRDAAVDIERLPEPGKTHMQTASARLADLGFVDPLIEQHAARGPSKAAGGKLVGTCLRARHTSGRFILQVLFSFTGSGLRKGEDQLVTFLSEQTITATSNGRPKFNRIPGSDATYHTHAPVDELLSIHERKLAALETILIPIHNNDDMVRHVDAQRQRYFDHMVRRGIFVESAP